MTTERRIRALIEQWPIVNERTIIENSHVRIREVTFRNPATGEERPFVIFGRPDRKKWGAVILPITKEMEVVTIREFMQGIGRIVRLLPGGTSSFGEEKLEEVCKRELLEETGHKAGRIIALGSFFREPRNLDIYTHPFLALECVEVGKAVSEDTAEETEVSLIPLDEWLAMIESGEIEDPAAIIATVRARPYLRKFFSKTNGAGR